MNQTENSAKQKQQNRSASIALTALIVTAFCMVVLSQESRYLDMHTQKLILTQQGCGDISSFGLNPRHGTSGCSIIARYSPGFFGSHGAILLDDDKFVTLSSSTVLANSDTDETLPDTPDQNRAQLILWGVGAALIIMVIVLGYDTYKAKKLSQKGNQS